MPSPHDERDESESRRLTPAEVAEAQRVADVHSGLAYEWQAGQDAYEWQAGQDAYERWLNEIAP